MTIKCKCGGRLVRTDVEAYTDMLTGRTVYRDTDPTHANWKCNKCGVKRTQRKRQAVVK